MGEKTGIAWTDSTFNIAWGCQKVSPGCAHCYAAAVAKRHGFNVFGPAATTTRRTFGNARWHEPVRWNRNAAKNGVRHRVFCSSMADVFEDHPTIDEQRARLWPLIRSTPHLDWQLLTKRPERIAECLPADWGAGYANVWLGTSIESDTYASRAHRLIAVPAVVHFISAEPLLGALNLRPWLDVGVVDASGRRGISWVIAGGESGAGARECHEAWLQQLRDDCNEFGTAFFLKQLGGPRNPRAHELAVLRGRTWTEMPEQAA